MDYAKRVKVFQDEGLFHGLEVAMLPNTGVIESLPISDEVLEEALARIQYTPQMAAAAPCENHLDEDFVKRLKQKDFQNITPEEMFATP